MKVLLLYCACNGFDLGIYCRTDVLREHKFDYQNGLIHPPCNARTRTRTRDAILSTQDCRLLCRTLPSKLSSELSRPANHTKPLSRILTSCCCCPRRTGWCDRWRKCNGCVRYHCCSRSSHCRSSSSNYRWSWSLFVGVEGRGSCSGYRKCAEALEAVYKYV